MVTMMSLARALSHIRETSPEMPLSCLVIFLYVAAQDMENPRGSPRKEPQTIKEIAQATGQPYTNAVRSLFFLSKEKEPGVAGLGWIETHTYPLDRRQKYATLTDKGRRVVETIMKHAGMI